MATERKIGICVVCVFGALLVVLALRLLGMF